MWHRSQDRPSPLRCVTGVGGEEGGGGRGHWVVDSPTKTRRWVSVGFDPGLAITFIVRGNEVGWHTIDYCLLWLLSSFVSCAQVRRQNMIVVPMPLSLSICNICVRNTIMHRMPPKLPAQAEGGAIRPTSPRLIPPLQVPRRACPSESAEMVVGVGLLHSYAHMGTANMTCSRGTLWKIGAFLVLGQTSVAAETGGFEQAAALRSALNTN